MKLFEIFADRHGHHENEWRAGAERKPQPSDTQKQAGLTAGNVWILSPDGKRVAGPFESMQKASSFMENRPDRVPKGSVARRIG